MTEKNDKLQVNAEPAKVQPDNDSYMPLCDIYEEADGTNIMVAEIPGAKSGTVDIRVDKGVLTISADGTRQAPGEDFNRTYGGFAGGHYFRAFALSDDVDRDSISATFKDGLLTLRLPKAPSAKTRKIPITHE
ncbi:MAG TPA: Hsp20/alpha crystallin family protein [Phycisphaerae bacterium]|nr:Hsp20/alpha crystallin family protein [Phycisphaerae bacterium]HPS52358.1 Hsp20/alpha crystallin family protein [Phycisphaerae bacterium]